MTARLEPATIAALGLTLALSACQPAPPPQAHQPYLGPTLTLNQLVGRVNDNNERIPTLWSRIHSFQAWLPDAQTHKLQYVKGDSGNLLFTTPASLRLIVSKEAVGPLFELGSDGSMFWLRQWQPDAVLWWGHYANLARANTPRIPVRPDLVMEVLGVLPIETDLLRQPVPVLRFDYDQDAYMLVWQFAGPDRWIAEKEIWYDRQTLRPKLIRLFDMNGRVVLDAKLSEFTAVETLKASQSKPPMVATRYELYFPRNDAKMNFELSEPCLSRNGTPRAATYRMNPAALGNAGIKVIDVDEDSAR